MSTSAFSIIFGTALFIMFYAAMLFQCNKQKPIAHILSTLSLLIMLGFIVRLWVQLGHPPLRTLGETRMWYALFLAAIGYVTYYRKQYNWFLWYSISMSLLFVLLNVINPENFNKELAPSLQSAWFAPHVIVYILGYALLAASALVGIYALYFKYLKHTSKNILILADDLIYSGQAFITLGLIFGALWAKQAWGHYWTWDPKETWAFLTWLVYLLYIHIRIRHPQAYITALWIISLAFVVLLLAWFGINYLPSAQNSVHVYGKG
jgi:ABC-type transport system involved in cytochrome c biogenesis permease subunit